MSEVKRSSAENGYGSRGEGEEKIANGKHIVRPWQEAGECEQRKENREGLEEEERAEGDGDDEDDDDGDGGSRSSRGGQEQGSRAKKACILSRGGGGMRGMIPANGDGGLRSSRGGQEQGSRAKKACILSIDGGGMRGVIPAKVLCYVEECLKQKSGNGEARIMDYFDVVAGTSVGGLIATMLCADDGRGRPLFSAARSLQLIARQGKRIFKIPPLKRPFAMFRGILTPRYSVKNMEAILKEQLVREDGRELTLKDALKPLLIPCYDLARAGPYVFTRADAMKSDSCNYRLADVCRATSAVPGFFRPAIIKSVDGRTCIIGVDGGLVMNNPAAAAVTHVLHNDVDFPYVRSVDDVHVLSLGTGLFDRCYEADKVKRWGAFQWAKPLARIVLDGISDMVDHSMSMAFSSHRDNYLRIQVSGIPSRCLTEMDDPSSSNVRRLSKIADDMLEQPGIEHVPFGGKRQLAVSNRERLHSFVDCLLAEHNSRLNSSKDSCLQAGTPDI